MKKTEKFFTEKDQFVSMRLPILSKLNDKIDHIVNDLNSLGEDIRGTSENISASADSMADSLTQTSAEFKETAQKIAESADSIRNAVEDFTNTTSATITQFESAIEKSVDKLVNSIEDFKNKILQNGIKMNLAGSAGSLVPRPQTGIMQGITTGIRDIIIPKRKSKEDLEETE